MAAPERKAGRGLAVVVSGPSGVGKTTVYTRLVERYGYLVSVSATTRAPRPGETDGVEYHFYEQDEFERAAERGEFLEYSEHFGNLYGTPAAPVRCALDQGKVILLEIDVNGARQVMERLPEAFCVFLIAPDTDEMERRLRGRHTDSEASIRTRLQRADMEIAMDMRYDARVVNDDVERAVEEIHSLIQKAEAAKTNEGGSA